MRRNLRRAVAAAVSFGLLGIIYWQIDLASLLDVIGDADLGWLAASFAMFVPTVLLTGWRLGKLVPGSSRPGLIECTELVLAASVLNLALPSKMGDLSKAWFLKDSGHVEANTALSLVVFEKACDLLALLVWCVAGLLVLQREGLFYTLAFALAVGLLAVGLTVLVSRRGAGRIFAMAERVLAGRPREWVVDLGEAWEGVQKFVLTDRRRTMEVALSSLGLWMLHLLQIWMFILVLGEFVPVLTSFALTSLAIFAGLLPVTLAGVGTRDAALVVLLPPLLTQAQSAALGLLCTVRYVVPALGGLPYFHRYFSRAMAMARRPEAR